MQLLLSDEDKVRLDSIGITNLLDLALLTPYKYENLFIKNRIEVDKTNIFDATVLYTSYNPKFLKVHFFLHNINKELDGIIFNARKYHYDKFKQNSRFFIKARVEYKFNNLQLIQPQILEKINIIEKKYKTKLQNKTISRIIREQISLNTLLKEGLDEKKAKTILDIHFPTLEFFNKFEKNGNFTQEEIYNLKYIDIYNHLKKLFSKRVVNPSKKVLNHDVNSFISSLPFKLTKDQLKVIEDIKRDFSKNVAAKRVIMGDVGSGKTMVILASVVLAFGSKSILMAPTTVLATQIYEEALKYLPKNIRVTLVTNKSDKKDDLTKYDFLIGTHALLYRELPDCDLVMIDEQHRFGTKQRTLISKLVSSGKKVPHFLQFTATPIPRTLSMIQSSLVDISTIKELPYKKDIDTKIITPKEFLSLIEHIKSEIDKSRQTIIVYPLVDDSEVIDYHSIDRARSWWESNFEKVYVTYGKDKEKESVLEEFKNSGNILIATTLVEVGISLPRLSTIVIVAPERLGLASLHQLRGRVSRNGIKGYCFLYTKIAPSVRLKKFCNTLDGFEIAQLDLQFRESGDLLKGDAQSGKSFKWFDPKEDEEILKEVKLLFKG